MSGRKVSLSRFEDSPGYRAASRISGRPSSEKELKLFQANKLVYKHQQILNFLSSGGALLSHINAVDLIDLENHLIAQEHDLNKNKQMRSDSN